jgi:hypothetical protein
MPSIDGVFTSIIILIIEGEVGVLVHCLGIHVPIFRDQCALNGFESKYEILGMGVFPVKESVSRLGVGLVLTIWSPIEADVIECSLSTWDKSIKTNIKIYFFGVFFMDSCQRNDDFSISAGNFDDYIESSLSLRITGIEPIPVTFQFTV